MADTWDESKPAGSRSPTLGDDDIREFKRAIRERLAEDHIFESTENPAFGAAGGYDIGKHKFLTLVQRNTSKVTASDEVAFVCKEVSGNPELLLTPPSAGTDRQITKNAGANFNLNSSDFDAAVIPASGIMADAVNSSHIADDSIYAAMIASDQVNSSHMPDYAIGAAQLNTSAVETAKIAANGVTAEKASHGLIQVLQVPEGVKEWSDVSGSTTTVSRVKIKLPSGATAINGEARIKCNSNNAIDCEIRIGGQTMTATRDADSYSWTAFNSAIDVSGLTAGTVYDLLIRLDSRSGGRTAYLNGLSLWWE